MTGKLMIIEVRSSRVSPVLFFVLTTFTPIIYMSTLFVRAKNIRYLLRPVPSTLGDLIHRIAPFGDGEGTTSSRSH